jgi:DNA-directed RNA polymerase specialized sigma subunit
MESQFEGGSVTRWIRQLKQGDENALTKLWERYFPAIKRKARAQFGNDPRVARDEEDIALSVMGDFGQAIHLG